MARSLRLAVPVFLVLALVACAAPAAKPLIDPFPLRFPLVEAGKLEIEGHVAGQPRARDGIVYFATREGCETAVVVPSRSVLWRRAVDANVPAVAGPPDQGSGIGNVALRAEGSRLTAVDPSGAELWETAVEGRISAAPTVRGSRVYFGTAARMFLCLDASAGRVKWRRRLQGAPIHAAVVIGKTVVVAASNSVVYRLSAKGGSILSWEAVPSRIVYEPAAAGTLVLISSATPTLVALDPRTGKRAGQYEAPGLLACGAVWAPPFVVVFVEDQDSGRQRIIFLRTR
jgi:outer membrane protein assembly factor BamB